MMAVPCKRSLLLLVLLMLILSGCKQNVSYDADQIACVDVPFYEESYLVENCYHYQYDDSTKSIWFFNNLIDEGMGDDSDHFWGTVMSISTESYDLNTILDLKESEESISAMYYDAVDQRMYVAVFKRGPAPYYETSNFALKCYSTDGVLEWTREFEEKIAAITRKGDIQITCYYVNGNDRQIFWLNDLLQSSLNSVQPSNVCDRLQNGDIDAQLVNEPERMCVSIKINQHGRELQSKLYQDTDPLQIKFLYLLEDRLIYQYNNQILCWDFLLDTEDLLFEAETYPDQNVIHMLDNGQIVIQLISMHHKDLISTLTENIYDPKERKVVKTRSIQMKQDEDLAYMPMLFYYFNDQDFMGVYRHKDDSVQIYRYRLKNEQINDIQAMPG